MKTYNHGIMCSGADTHGQMHAVIPAAPLSLFDARLCLGINCDNLNGVLDVHGMKEAQLNRSIVILQLQVSAEQTDFNISAYPKRFAHKRGNGQTNDVIQFAKKLMMIKNFYVCSGLVFGKLVSGDDVNQNEGTLGEKIRCGKNDFRISLNFMPLLCNC